MCNQRKSALSPLKAEGYKQGHVLRVLVVDDNTDAAESLALLLRLWGHAVSVAPDGPSALEIARDHRPQVVLLDLGLPGMDGYEVARQLRGKNSVARPGGLILWALTGYGQEEDRRRCREAGFDRHLVKPVDPETLEIMLAQSEWVVEQDAQPVSQESVPTSAEAG